MTISLLNELLILPVTPAISATPDYITGDLMGGKLELTNVVETAGAGGVIDSCWLTDLAAQDADIDAIWFNADPTNTTFTDNVAFTIADADLAKIIGFHNITSYIAFADNSFGRGEAARQLPFIAADTSIFAALIARAAFNAGTVADLVFSTAIWRV